MKGVRIRGIILVVLGAALAIGMAWLLGEIAPAMAPDGRPSGARFTGDAEQGRLITNILIGVMALGIVFALYGLFMAVTGKESRVMRVFAFILLLAMIGAALATGWTPGGPSRPF